MHHCCCTHPKNLTDNNSTQTDPIIRVIALFAALTTLELIHMHQVITTPAQHLLLVYELHLRKQHAGFSTCRAEEEECEARE